MWYLRGGSSGLSEDGKTVVKMAREMTVSRQELCHVCGRPAHAVSGHTFWSNADADAEAREYDRRVAVTYSDGTTSPEAHYVMQYVPEAVAR